MAEQPNLYKFPFLKAPKKGFYQEYSSLRKQFGAYEESQGGIYGALDPDSKRARIHSEKYYNLVRKMKTDAKRISENTGFRQEDIQRVKNHVFLESHNLGESGIRPFFPSYKMGQSWQRLIHGKNIQPHDITLLNHEFLESVYMKEGFDYSEAHIKAAKLYDYDKESIRYNQETGKW